VGSLVQQLITGMALMGAPWLGVLIAEPGLLFEIVLGEAWRDAGLYAGMLAAPALLFVLTNWLDRLLDVAHRQDANLKLEVVASVLSVGGFWALLWAGASLPAATFGQSAALVLAYLLVLTVVYKLCGYPLSPLFRALSAATVLGGLAWGVTAGTALLAGGLVGLAVGAGLALALSGIVALRVLRPVLGVIASAR
jgi:O-antigen/teichoic acid export membrane protein